MSKRTSRVTPKFTVGRVKAYLRDGGRYIYLDWRYQGKRYQKSTRQPDTPIGVNAAQRIASDIERDLAYGDFDAQTPYSRIDQRLKPVEVQATADLFTQFIEYKLAKGLVVGQTVASKYRSLHSKLTQFGRNVLTDDDARSLMELLKQTQGPKTLNQNRSILISFGEWAVEGKHIEANPFTAIKPLKVPRNKSPKRIPPTLDEFRAIITAFRHHKYYWRYHDYVLTLAYLGARPSEVIGLRWKDIDWLNRRVHIAESLSRGEDGKTSGRARQRKPTKNHKVRWVKLTDRLFAMFQGRRQPYHQPDDLIFTAPNGGPIDHKTFSRRGWKKICKQVGIKKTRTHCVIFLPLKPWSRAGITFK